MSVFAFAGAAQFAAVGYVAPGLPWAPIVVLTFFLNARHLLYSASLAPRLRDVPFLHRAAMAHVLTDEAFALAATHFHRLGRVDVPGYWIGAVLGVFIPWNLATLAGVLLGGAIPDPSRFGLDVVFPAAMAGLAVGLVTGRRELVAAGAGAAIGVVLSLRSGRPSGSWPAGCSGRWSGWRCPRAAGRSSPDSDLSGLPVDLEEAFAEMDELPAGGHPMSTELVLLAVLMAAVTYPSRALPLLAPGIERLPPRALLYLRLVGPAVLASIAAAQTLVRTADTGARAIVSARAIGVLVCLAVVAWRRNLLPRAGRGRRARRRRQAGRPPASGPGEAPRLRLDLDQQARPHQARHHHERRRRAHVPEDLAVHRGDGIGVGRVRDVHPGPDHVVQREAGLAQRALDDRERRPRLGGGIARVERLAVRPGVRGARDPAEVADGEGSRVAADASQGPPLRRGAGSRARRARPCVAAGASARQAPTSGSRPMVAIRAASSDGPRHDRGNLQVLPRRVVQPADGAQAVERRHAHARRRVRVRGTAGGGVAELEARGRRRARWHGRRAGRTARASPSANGGRSPRSPPSRPARARHERSRGSPPRPPRGPSRVTARTSTSMRAPLRDHVGPRPALDDADVDGHARPAAVERVQLRDDAGGLEDRAAALLGLDAGVGRPAVDGDRRGPGCPSGTRRCRRSRARTRGRGRRPRRAASRRMWGVETGEPISSSGLATKTQAREGAAAEAVAQRRRSRTARPAARSSCRSRRGRWRCPPGSRTGAPRRSPRRTRCPCGRCTAASGPPGSVPANSPTTVSPRPWSLGWLVTVRRAPAAAPPSSARSRPRRPSCSCRSRC